MIGSQLKNDPVQAAVRLDAVSKLYGSFAALRKVTAEFAAGSSTVILGENGAGKSTLLRLVAGLALPTRGTVTVFGDEPARQRRRIAYMSHETMLYDELSAMENLRYFYRLQQAAADGRECEAAAQRSLRRVGLDPALNRPVGQYSQGMRQRASLARVLLTDPELLLLDEPFSNLDKDSVRRMVDLLMEFRGWPTGCDTPGGRASGENAPDGDAQGGDAQGVSAPEESLQGGNSQGDVRVRTLILTTHQAHLAGPLAETTLTLRAGTVLSVASSADCGGER